MKISSFLSLQAFSEIKLDCEAESNNTLNSRVFLAESNTCILAVGKIPCLLSVYLLYILDVQFTDT